MRKCPYPDCDLTTTTLDHYILESSDGPIEHVKLKCPSGHWFNMPTFLLTPMTGKGWIFK